ncbi:MAG: response regulator transcription factor [Bacteroidia bacterium]|jgi:DNA-binding response OmpR family regulator|nr:response regulator transcription factor [Bacteroidia bacterium]
MIKVILIDDDIEVSKYVQIALGQFENIELTSRNSVELGLALLKSEPYDIVILDIMMPDINGIEASKAIRLYDEKIGILFISNQHELEVKSRAFNAGGDDFLVKPFHPEELIMRLFALYKRVNPFISSSNATYELGKLVFKADKQRIVNVNGIEVKLSSKECEVLTMLVERPNTVTKRRDLLINIWGRTDPHASNLLDVYVNRLRKILKDEPSVLIENVHGTGFKLTTHNF